MHDAFYCCELNVFTSLFSGKKERKLTGWRKAQRIFPLTVGFLNESCRKDASHGGRSSTHETSEVRRKSWGIPVSTPNTSSGIPDWTPNKVDLSDSSTSPGSRIWIPWEVEWLPSEVGSEFPEKSDLNSLGSRIRLPQEVKWPPREVGWLPWEVEIWIPPGSRIWVPWEVRSEFPRKSISDLT